MVSCGKLGHLIKMTATSVDTLRETNKITSIRLINRVVEEVCTALTQYLRELAAVGEWQEGGGQLLTCTTPHLDKYHAVGKKPSTKCAFRF